MARTLQQVMAELESTGGYSGSRNVYQAKLNAIPGEIEAGIAQADAKLGQANDNILTGARRRGIGFSGIPIGEQAEFAATEYAPAIANLKASGRNQELSIMDALSGLDREKGARAQGIFDNEQNRAFQQQQFQESIRQFNVAQQAAERQAAAARSSASADVSRYLGGGAAGQAAAPAARVEQRAPGSFAFYDAGNKPITAAQYAVAANRPLGEVLFEMGNAGDARARQVYNQLKAVSGAPAVYQRTLDTYKKSMPYLLGGI